MRQHAHHQACFILGKLPTPSHETLYGGPLFLYLQFPSLGLQGEDHDTGLPQNSAWVAERKDLRRSDIRS